MSAASAAAAAEEKKKLTVFKSDRHEDMGSIIATALVVVGILVYMAFLVGTVNLGAPADGKVLSVVVTEGQQVAKGTPLFTMEAVEKKMVDGKLEEKTVTKEVKAKVPGTVTKVAKAPGDAVKKGAAILVFAPEKGYLP